MSVGGALGNAVRDFYAQSWRLLVLNGALSACALVMLSVGLWFTPALVLLVLIGPLAAALMHCAITLSRTGELALHDALTGLRLHWRRGLVLGLFAFAVVACGALAVPFYARLGGWAWPLALVALYLAVVLGTLQLLLWPLAVFEFDRSLSEVSRDALQGFLRRPAAGTALALALLAINVAGLAAALIPFLTLTVGYSFLAAAHFALPRPERGATTAWPA